jgi:hypothetical protein
MELTNFTISAAIILPLHQALINSTSIGYPTYKTFPGPYSGGNCEGRLPSSMRSAVYSIYKVLPQLRLVDALASKSFP